VVAAAYVSAEEGTGCVHTAPGHGADDFRTGKENGLPPFSPLDDHGRYTPEAGAGLAGKRVPDEANGAVLPLLAARLLHEEKVLHSCAHCWRCHRPIVYRATDQWFVQVDHLDLRKRALEEVGRVRWVPEWGARRISGMLASRPDWCISRQRHWGIPIPALRCAGCDHVWTSPEIVSRTREVVRREGADSWFDRPVHAIVGSQACPACGGREAVPARDIFDVWFESGTSWRAVVQREGLGLGFPSDAVLEGTDQHRGWFQSSLLPAVAVEGRAPWRTVVTHGFIVDEGGDKVSKSKGGMLHADVLAREFGADVARLWVASIEYREDAPVSRDLLRRTGEVYRRIRNTFRWLLGNLDGFDPARDAVPDGDLLEADRWVLARLDRVAAEYVEAFGAFDWARGLRAVHEFCDRDLSAFWFDANKDRFYCDEADGPRRRSGRTAAWRLADSLCRLLAPVLPHTMEEVWGALPGARGGSVHLETWPAPAAAAPDAGALLARWEDLRRLRDAVLAACEPLRARKEIGSNLEARVAIAADAAVPGMGFEELAGVLMVSEVVPGEPAAGGGAPVVATPSPHPRCARCWNLRPGVGRDSRFPDLCGRCAAVVGSGAPAAPSGG
jgi:isoleucyl-tRNA synthetase